LQEARTLLQELDEDATFEEPFNENSTCLIDEKEYKNEASHKLKSFVPIQDEECTKTLV
jgi:hypothetical protein